MVGRAQWEALVREEPSFPKGFWELNRVAWKQTDTTLVMERMLAVLIRLSPNPENGVDLFQILIGTF